MSLCAISDLHIKAPGDKGHLLLQTFLAHPQVRSANHIALLGDIFDIWVGDISHKYEAFKDIFDDLAVLAREGKTIYYFEGNHDLHLKNLEVRVPGIQYVKDYVVLSMGGREILLSHGDWFDDQDRFYYHYRRFIGSDRVAKWVLSIFGESRINSIGAKASTASRSRGSERYQNGNSQIVIDKFRSLAAAAAKELGVEFIVWGHSHARDLFRADGYLYLNNGYGPNEALFNYVPAQGEPLQISLI